MRFLITGASGLIGSNLSSYLKEHGHLVISLTRNKRNESDLIWNPDVGILPPNETLEDFDCFINLAGENLMTPYWSKEKKRKIRESRVQGTSLLVQALKQLKKPPKIFISASATGFYGSRRNEILSESAAPGSCFLSDTCVDWEASAWQASQLGIRVAILRIGMVLAKEGGAIKKMLPLFKKGLGSYVGTGDQWISWITLQDLIRMIYFIASHTHLSGVFNATSPNPVTNKIFTEELAKSINRKTFIPIPEWAIRIIMRDFAKEILLSSTYAIPTRAFQSNFIFNSPTIHEAISSCL